MTKDEADKQPTFLQAVGQQLAAQKLRAQERLKTYGRGHWNFAFVGLNSDVASVNFEGLATFRVAEEPPDAIFITAALEDRNAYATVGRYLNQIKYELEVTAATDKATFNIAWWLIACLRVKTLAEFLVPVAADCSWSVVAAIGDNSCKTRLMEDVPQARMLAEEPVKVTAEDFRWAFSKALTMGKLVEIPRFALAVEALTTHQHLLSPRMMAASIWSGIEALMDIGNNELRFRLALSVASLLEPRGEQRYDRYRQTVKLYDVRSKAVHGSQLDKAAIRQHVIECRTLLSDLIIYMLDAQKVLSREEIEHGVLG